MVLLFPYHLDHTYVLWLAVGSSRQKPQKKGGPSAQLDKQAEDAVTCHFIFSLFRGDRLPYDLFVRFQGGMRDDMVRVWLGFDGLVSLAA